MALAGTKQKKLIELVKQHHPHMGETEIRELLNDAQKEICEQSGLLKAWFDITTVADTRFYDLDSNIITVLRVEITDSDGIRYGIPRLVNRPETGESV